MKSFRLQFIDIDGSYTINTTEAPIKGYMVCRAPKGTTEAMYFPYGNEKAINAMIGLPTANWIDIYEAVAFNQEYGLYISAPPGTGVDHPSYYGGVYLTTHGPFDYWEVSDDKAPSFEVCISAGGEDGAWGDNVGNAYVDIIKLSDKGKTQGCIKIEGFSATLFARTNYLRFNYWGDDVANGHDAGVYTYSLSGSATKGVLYYVDPDDGEIKDYYCGEYKLESDGTYTIYIGETDVTGKGYEKDKTANNTTSAVAPYITFEGLFDYSKLKTETGEFRAFKVNNGDVITADAAEDTIKTILFDGKSAEFSIATDEDVSIGDFEEFYGLGNNRIQWRVNIKNITFARVHQKSPNETPTYVSISNIGYDKWKYDQSCAWVDITTLRGSALPEGIKTDTPTMKNISGFTLADGWASAIIQGNTDGLVVVHDGDVNKFGIFKLDTTTQVLTDVTSAYLTQRFYINSRITDSKDITSVKAVGIEDFIYNVYEVVSASVKGMSGHKFVQCKEDDPKYPLKKDVNYNTLTISCKEVVIPGEYTTGGEFTGSLSETGVDSYGSNIYWPNILPEETVTFMEVVPEATFDDLKAINDQGFYTGTKIVDPIGPAKDVYTNYLKGQRYCTYVNEKNQKDGVLGSAWRDEYYQIVKDGLIEAQNPVYDDALVFMELTGYEDFKSLLMSLRVVYHDTSTIISPKIITKAQLANPKTITVSGRSKGTAQYIGEFRKYDTYTGKYYYCQPIGDVGLQLARIMDKKLGGIAPAGTNDSAGLGGCLARSVLSAKYQFSDEALQILDEKGLCAITYDADYGLMIQSQKSTQDPATVTDWSYLGHSMSFDLCKREIRDKVMTQQVFKRISPYYMDMRTKQVQAILDKRTTGPDPIWATASVDITGQNTPTTMAKRQFVIKVTCKVYVYSETVLLIFENLSQE